ncbi:MAG: Hsp20/alpha crystallin family protein [Patescibacteria group bacterium]|nr:Hsp20/alpha crystallin family protein [Patescibacteria group bacterium]MDD4304681.1 Hsp20/alpha crystallin family protein [Patescibacteria group bacterium]MDD4695351.1 Hsp20/alpha crystallin family protein [Patescibacteria group bacterium]
MQLIKWSPMFDEDEDLFNFPAIRQANLPSLDIYQDKDNVYAKVALPGVDPEKVDITIENDILSVRGSSEKKSEIDEKNYYRKEIRFGSFHRSVQLPTHVNGDKAKAEFENGILKIQIPKKEEVKPKKIAIQVKKK